MAQGAESVTGQRSGGTGGGPGPAGMHAAEPVEVRTDAAVALSGGPGGRQPETSGPQPE
jgi:hypothetical protein